MYVQDVSLNTTIFEAREFAGALTMMLRYLHDDGSMDGAVHWGKSLTQLLGLQPMVTHRYVMTSKVAFDKLRERVVFLEGFSQGADSRMTSIEDEVGRLRVWCAQLQRGQPE